MGKSRQTSSAGRLIRRTVYLTISAALIGAGLSLLTGHLLTAPALGDVGPPPSGFRAESVEIPVSGGQSLRGWHFRGLDERTTVLLFHPLRGSRRAMTGRAKFLHRAGYDVLAVDFRAHGESDGERITLGPGEAEDVRAVVGYVRRQSPHVKIGVIGVSLGGAAVILNGASLEVNALVAEAVYADLITATKNRLRMRFGEPGTWLSPLLTWQISALLGFDPLEQSPERRARGLSYPVLLLYGTQDRRATPAEGRRLAAAIGSRARLNWVEGAGHVDLHGFLGRRYEERVVAFLDLHLR